MQHRELCDESTSAGDVLSARSIDTVTCLCLLTQLFASEGQPHGPGSLLDSGSCLGPHAQL